MLIFPTSFAVCRPVSNLGGDLVAPRNGLPSESRVDVVPVTGRLQLTERRIPKLFSFGQLQALNNTSSFSEVFSLSSTSSSTVASTPTGSCTESVSPGSFCHVETMRPPPKLFACYLEDLSSVLLTMAYFTSA